MDPTTAIPVHLTCETVVLAAAGLVLAWAALRRNWPGAISALALVVVQGLHAGQFIEQEDDPWLLAFRLAGIVGLGLTVLRTDLERRLFGLGLLALAAGSLWDGVIGGSSIDVTVGPHVLRVAGAAVLLVWVWRATRPSVRLRVLAAFVAVLAIAVVVAGGAVARVAAVNSRDEQFARLAVGAATIRRSVIDSRDLLARRTAALSPFLSNPVANRRVEVDPIRLLPGEWVAVLDANGDALRTAATSGVTIPYETGHIGSLAIVRSALAGEVSTMTSGTTDGLDLIASAPVYRPGGKTIPADVIGAVVVGRSRTVSELRAVTADAKADVAILDGGRVATTEPTLRGIETAAPRDRVALRTLETGRDRWLTAISPLPDGDGAVVVAAPISIVVEAARELVRAFLVAILAAALLAVITALWLSTRIARPMIDLAEEAERLKVDFLASVSHELRTPLTPIRGYTDLLRRGRVPESDASGYLDEIGQAAQRLERIVALLVDVASMEAGRFRIDAYDVPSADLLTDAEKRWKGRSRRNQIKLDLEQALPNVMADPEAIARVLDELLDNALKFSPGSPIKLGAHQIGDAVEFSVADEGPGIDLERVEALREAFRQADTGDTRHYGGLGLGLTFSEGVLNAHGSRLDIATGPDEGTTCSFTLPAASSVTRMSSRAASRRTESRRTQSRRTASRKR
jgi:signal transduction histidine kinase